VRHAVIINTTDFAGGKDRGAFHLPDKKTIIRLLCATTYP